VADVYPYTADWQPEGNDRFMKTTVRNLISAGLICGAAIVMSTGAWAADAAAGKALYATKCKSCHGADGTPPAAMAKALGVKPLSDPGTQGKSDGDLKSAILKGIGKMKAQSVSDGDADNLVAAIRTMK
jgi:mono/diheme cytochrome c family protein